jgi:entericidin B
MKHLKTIGLTIAAAAIVSIALTGCQTVKGFGEDLSAGGKAISHAAQKSEGDHKDNNGKTQSKAKAKQ